MDSDATPGFGFREATRRIVVGALAGDDGHVVPSLRQRHGEVGQMLRRRDDVGVEGLVKEEDFQG